MNQNQIHRWRGDARIRHWPCIVAEQHSWASCSNVAPSAMPLSRGGLSPLKLSKGYNCSNIMSISMTVSVWGFSWSTSSMRCFAFFSFSHCTASAVTPATSTSPTCLFSWYFCFPSDFILFFWLYLNEMPSDAVVRPWRTQQL